MHAQKDQFSPQAVQIWNSLHATNGTSACISLLSNSLSQQGRLRTENQGWPQDNTTLQESGVCSWGRKQSERLKAALLAPRQSSKVANLCMSRWRWEESSQLSMFSSPLGLLPDVWYRTDPLNSKPSRCLFITVLIWWDRVLQHYLGTTNCLLSILLGNNRS